MIVVTGGYGFIGSNFIINYLNNSKDHILNIDLLTYAANQDNLNEYIDDCRYTFLNEDIGNIEEILKVFFKNKPKKIINFAAESHVDNSIKSPDSFIQTNINGTYNLLKATREYWEQLQNEDKKNFRFIHVSTDEVFGSLNINDPPFTENSQYAPNSPYSASKASSDHLVRCFHHTYNLPTIITNCSNNYGPYQHIEKFIPKIIFNALNNIDIPIYGDGSQIRDWLYVEDHVEAISLISDKGIVGETYNIGGNNEKTNIEVAENICELLDSYIPEKLEKVKSYLDLIKKVDDRPGHDTRYAINSTKIQNNLGWIPKKNFDSGINETIKWYLANIDWCNDSIKRS